MRPGYSPIGMQVSELSLGPRGWIQVTNFLIFGTLFLVFVRAVRWEFPTGKASKAGSIILAIIAFSYLVSGPFVMDRRVMPTDRYRRLVQDYIFNH